MREEGRDGWRSREGEKGWMDRGREEWGGRAKHSLERQAMFE